MPQKILSFSVAPADRNLIEALLQSDYEITSVETPQAVLRLIAVRRPDAILAVSLGSADPLLPFFSALQTETTIPLLVVAPGPIAADALLIRKTFCHYLRAPFTPHQLRTKLEGALQKSSVPPSPKPDAQPFLLMEQLASEVANRIERSLTPLRVALLQSQGQGEANASKDHLSLLQRPIGQLEQMARSLISIKEPLSAQTFPIRSLIEHVLEETPHELLPGKEFIEFQWEKNPLPVSGNPESLRQTIGLILRSFAARNISRLLIRTTLQPSLPTGPRMKIEISAFSSYSKTEAPSLEILLAQKRLWDQGISLVLSAKDGKSSASLDAPVAPASFKNRIQCRRVLTSPIPFAERRKGERRAAPLSLPDPSRV